MAINFFSTLILLVDTLASAVGPMFIGGNLVVQAERFPNRKFGEAVRRISRIEKRKRFGHQQRTFEAGVLETVIRSLVIRHDIKGNSLQVLVYLNQTKKNSPFFESSKLADSASIHEIFRIIRDLDWAHHPNDVKGLQAPNFPSQILG